MYFRLPTFQEVAKKIFASTRKTLGIKKKKNKKIKPSLNSQIRNLDNNYKWRQEILKRDNFKCVICESKSKLEVDHIKPLSFLIKKHNILIAEQAILCKDFWNIDNGRTLCKKCHKKTNTYAGKSRKFVEENLE